MKLLEPEEISREPEEVSGEQEKKITRKGFQPNITTVVLLVIIVVLLVVILGLIVFTPVRNRSAESVSMVEQDIMDYARQQQENDPVREIDNDPVKEVGKDVIIVESQKPPVHSEENSTDDPQMPDSDSEKFEIIDEEDENDISYTKEYILNEMTPYFADNNLEAVWDLAHLKRYIKLSEGLKGTNTFYYQGDLDEEGKPHGRGLAIYESNSYYYGAWVHGLREGDGRWYHFYIDESDEITLNQIYTAHSYSGNWKNDLPNGEGAEHFDLDTGWTDGPDMVITNVIGNFTDGLYDGDMFANTVNYYGKLNEWNAVARNGEFKLWKKMKSTGECSVWRNADDKNLYIEIDKSENKNQGITELLGL